MSFKRVITPRVGLEGQALDRAMAGIGMNFAAKPDRHTAIEDVLFFASQLGWRRTTSACSTWCASGSTCMLRASTSIG